MRSRMTASQPLDDDGRSSYTSFWLGSSSCLIWSDCLEGFDEIAGKGLARRDDVYPLIADLIRAERTQRLHRLSLQHIDAPISVKWFSGAESKIVGDHINSRRS